MASTASYRAVLRAPGALRTFGAALTGRLSYGVVFLALVVALTKATASYPVAGFCLALFAATLTVLAPVRAALIDRYGIRRALTPLAAVYATCLAALAAATYSAAAVPLLAALCALAGAMAPPLGPTMRGLWSRLFDDERLRQRAFSLDTVAEELLLVGGPLLAGVFIALGVPSVGVAVSAVLVLGGTVAFVTSPVAGEPIRRAPAVTRGRRRELAGVLAPAAACAGAGFSLGTLNLLVVAVATQRGQPAAVAWIEAALATGSALGGLAYGAVSWRLSSRARLVVLGCVLGALLGLAGLSPSLVVLGAVVFAAGVFVAPTLTTAYLLADQRVGAAHRTQAGTWVNTAFNAGSTAGTAAAGVLATALPHPASFALAGAAMVIAALAAGVGPDTFMGWRNETLEAQRRSSS